MIEGFISAVRTLTIIPIHGKDAEDLSSAVAWFSLVGFLLSLVLVLFIYIMLRLTNQYQLIAILTVFLGAFLTRGIHLDGLADFADGFGGGFDKEKILTIMKDSDIGTFGALSLIFVVIIKWLAVLKMVKTDSFSLIIPAYVVSRFSMSYLSVFMPYARKKAGIGKPFVENAKTKDAVIAFAVSFVLVAIAAKGAGIAMLFSGFFITFLLRLLYMKKLGGVTGDLLGATSEIIETLLLICGFYFNIYLKGFIL